MSNKAMGDLCLETPLMKTGPQLNVKGETGGLPAR